MKKANPIERKNNAKARNSQRKPGENSSSQEKPATTSARSGIHEDWEEVAMIDFTIDLNRDCNERIIYKTPEGALMSVRLTDPETEVIEDVTRDQVTEWIHEYIIPYEFQEDFRKLEARRLSELELIQLNQLYNRYGEMSFEDAMANFAGVAQLLSENTAPEVQALKRMVQAETELNKTVRAKARAL